MDESYLNDILDDNTFVLGEIYAITNTLTNHSYIGQTLTHRLNHRKYRPYGYNRRFNSHISEALCNKKKNQCSCLANAIRKYGKDAFQVRLLIRCERSQLDDLEKHFIRKLDTIYPNGYNLAQGGNIKHSNVSKTFEVVDTRKTPIPRTNYKDDITRSKISNRMKMYIADNKEDYLVRILKFKQAKDVKKAEKLRGCHVDLLNLDSYIQTRHRKDGSIYPIIIIEGHRVDFNSVYDSYEVSVFRALQLLKDIANNDAETATLSN